MIPFTHAEVMKEWMLQSVKVIEGEETIKKKPENSFIKRHCHPICQSLREFSQSSCFSLDADECTDISDVAQLSVFVRFFNGERFVEEFVGIANIVSVVTDGAPAMASEKEGQVGKLKQISSRKIPYHCIIHNIVLCAKLSKDFFPLLTEITKLVNFFRSRSALTHRILKQFLNYLDSEFKDVLLYNNVKWLSKGQMLNRVWGLRGEIVLFLELMDTSEKDNFLNLLQDPNQLARLSFLVDILSYLNNLNLSLQGTDIIQQIYELKDWFSIDEVKLKLEMCDFSVQLSVNEIFKTSTDYINFWIEL
ncbi:hypothetical protein PR048_004722 [Dryococelus australis]|uniref:DUF4371 domain-containing protein n=1 Tax=Dryococelus australis TaxID=614101 RepID=A0ABQ9I675_9NEOP|nr:hypothetical protein PR048_004722 [Dryococelus australis]